VFISYQGYALRSGTYTYISTMKQSPSGEIICSLAEQEFCCVLWKRKFQQHIEIN